jgi:biotin operon repressor
MTDTKQQQLTTVLLYLQKHSSMDSKVKVAELARMLGVDKPAIHSAINTLRGKGKPIGSDTGGYWWATTQEEIQPAIEYIQMFIDSHRQTRSNLKDIQERLPV